MLVVFPTFSRQHHWLSGNNPWMLIGSLSVNWLLPCDTHYSVSEEVRLLVNELSNCHYPALFDSSSGQDVALRLFALSNRDAGFQRLPPARLETRTKESNVCASV